MVQEGVTAALPLVVTVADDPPKPALSATVGDAAEFLISTWTSSPGVSCSGGLVVGEGEGLWTGRGGPNSASDRGAGPFDGGSGHVQVVGDPPWRFRRSAARTQVNL